MIDRNLIETLEEALNGKPCKHCGKLHSVKLSVLANSQREEIMAADAVVPRGECVVAVNLDEEACLAAQNDAYLFVVERTAGF